MNPEVQLHRSDAFCKMTQGYSVRELLVWLKGYTLGCFNLPLDHPSVPSILQQIDMFECLMDSGCVDRPNCIRIILHSIEKVPKQRKPAENKEIKTYGEYVEYFTGEVMTDPSYFFHRFDQPNQSYSDMFEECKICAVDLTPEDMLALECQHVFHIDCLYQHVKATIEGGQTTVKCPNEKCRIEISHQELSNLMTPQLEQKYHDYTLNKYVEEHGDCTSWCPTPDCDLVYEYGMGITLFDCKRCSRRYCLKCRCDYHEGMSCEEHRDFVGMSSEDQAFVQMAKGAKFKQCPKCKFWVERTKGCPSMKCRCGQDFCYCCGGISCPHGTCSNETPALIRERERERLMRPS